MGVSRVNNYSLYEFRSVQKLKNLQTESNYLDLISSGLIEFWCLWLPVALGRGQVGGGV